MTKVDEYTGSGQIVVSDGEVWAIDDSGILDVIGKIGRIELSIENPEEMLGISRVEHVMLYNENDEELYEDQEIVDNREYHSDENLILGIAKHYGVSEDIIEVI